MLVLLQTDKATVEVTVRLAASEESICRNVALVGT